MHADPARAANLGRMGGRRNRHYVETADRTISAPSTPEEVKNVLAQAMADVYAGKMHPRIAYALTQITEPLLRAMEDTDLQHRLERMEAELQSASGESEDGQTVQAAVDELLVRRAEARLTRHEPC